MAPVLGGGYKLGLIFANLGAQVNKNVRYLFIVEFLDYVYMKWDIVLKTMVVVGTG